MKTGRRGGADRTMTWLAPAILCVLAGHTPVQGSAIDRETLVALSNTQPKGPIPSSFTNPGMSSAIFVPVILTASGRNNSFFTSELTLTNRGGEEATLHYTYTAHRGGGSGTATDRLAPGRQRIESDAIGYLTNLGIPIPSSGNRIGTLRVEVSGSSGVGISVRTTTLVDDGRAGLAYSGIAATAGFEEVVYLCGLRQNSRDRSNVAFQNMGAPGEGAITLRATVYSGEAGDTEPRVFEEELPPGGFHQYNGILNLAAFDNGYVKVERVEGASPFYAYGVINDNFNSDGSFVFPLTASSLTGTTAQTLPVIVETGEFTSELTVTNFSEEPKTLLFSFVADRLSTPDRTARFRLKIGAGQQRIIPDVIDTQLRRKGVEGVSSSRGGLAGALFARVERGDMSGIVIGARTSSSDGRGGHYGVFYHAAPYGGAFLKEAWVDGLQQDGENRSNLALVNTGEVNGSASVFHLEIYNGETGMLEETVVTKPIPARRQHQINGILLRSNPETRQGYIRIEKVSGENPFLAYGVVNDGGAPGERSGDGAYLTATARIYDPGTEVMTDREVLEALYHATGGPGWKNRTHWLSAAPLSEWFGVETDASGRVTRLGLSRNGLSGEIPPELCQLTHLQVLDLRFNQLSGVIPPSLGELTQLQWLNLGANQLSGGIPPELGGLIHLETLQLWANQLSGGIPPELAGLTHLRGLNLASNELSGGIPPELGGLTHLEKLVLVSNQLSGEIPEELGQLSRLQELHLRGNRLSGEIPPELGQLTNLQDLNLRSNQLSGAIPPALGRLTKLRNLVLGYNELSGAIPAELGELTHLRGLDLGGNRLSGAIPKNLQQLSELTSLDIRDTGICVPADAAFRAWLETLTDFGTSGLVCDGTRRVLFSASSYEVREGETVEVVVWLIDQTGDPVQSTEIPLTAMPVGGATAADYSGVPESVTITAPATEAGFVFTAVADAPFDTGETVVLGFRGPLPSGVTAGSPDTATVTITDPGTVGVTDREVLEALHQATDGPNWSNRTHWLSAAPLSEWFGVATDGSGRVTSLALGNNRLSGTIPPSLGQLTRLQGLNLGANQLSGEIPSELGGLTHLETLQLWANQLSGAIPPELAGLTLLRGLNLGGNQLSGGIPPELAGLTHLETLHLWANQLSGAIPPELGGLTHLETLNLVSNQLSGEIPEELGQLTHLQWLSLGSNELSGAIPPELGGLTRLETLHLSANQLSGAIPPELAGLTHLETLHLWANQLSGAIPPELGQLTQLQRLVLVDNDLSGAIPPELGELTNLLWLNLGGNGLSGAIPPELGQLTQLQRLVLVDNDLSGAIPPELGQLSRLQGLYLGTNNLSGGIPPELGGLTHLETLNLGSNELKGGIPPELGGMTHLDGLVLGFNPHLTGTIPPELQQLPLSTLNLMATSVCVSEDAELQEWLATIEFVSSGLTCGRPPPAMPSIDILVVYTPTARSIAGGTAEMEAEIDLKIAETNQAYLDGGVNQRLVLVAREEVEYSGSGSGFVDLRRLADASDGYMDEVHAIRDRSGADLLHLIADVTDVGGVAFLGGAYGITCAKCGSGTFAHELGHNMGLHHDRYVQRSAPFPYSHGYVNQQAFTNGAPESARWRTIMAYVNQCGDAGFSCDRTMRFSNPNQTYLGDPLGVPGDQRTVAVNGPADAARALNLTRHSVASFRPRASGNQLTMSSPVSQVPSLVRADRNWPAVPVPGGGLFRAVAPAVTGTGSRQAGSALDRATLRRREVSVDIGRLARLPSSGSTALRLNLFDDVVLTGIIERRTLTYSGGYALSGRLAGVAGGSVTLVVNGSVVAGTVRIPGATYRIRPAGAGRHAIMQVDPSQLPQGCETLRGTPDWEQ